MNFVTGIEPVLRRNADLYEQAKAKAARLDDGTETGRLKGELILALDDIRNKRGLVSFWGLLFEEMEDKFYGDQHALAQVDLREAKDAAAKLGTELEELGVSVKLVRRDGYCEPERGNAT